MKSIKLLLPLLILLSLKPAFSSDEMHINADNVNVRLSPDIKSSIIGLAKIGTSVKVIKKSDSMTTIGDKKDYWYYCNVFSTTGWIFGSYISDGRFQEKDYIARLVPVSDIPPTFSSAVGTWTSCTPSEQKSLSMGCYDLIITNSYVKNESPGPFPTYQITEIKEISPEIFKLKVKLVLSDSLISSNYFDETLKFKGALDLYTITIKVDTPQKIIIINGTRHYKR